MLLWALLDPERIAPAARAQIESPDCNVYVSAVSVWEIEIKRSLGKLEVPQDLDEQLRKQRFTELPLRNRHVKTLAGLPPLHRDPFDRMLIAQCVCDELVMVSSDSRVLAYPVKSLAAG